MLCADLEFLSSCPHPHHHHYTGNPGATLTTFAILFPSFPWSLCPPLSPCCSQHPCQPGLHGKPGHPTTLTTMSPCHPCQPTTLFTLFTLFTLATLPTIAILSTLVTFSTLGRLTSLATSLPLQPARLFVPSSSSMCSDNVI